MRILHVDDDRRRAALWDCQLRRLIPNLDLETVATQPQAIARLAEQAIPRYDLALIGTSLPNHPPLPLLDFIREQQFPLAVVLLDEEDRPETAAAALSAGADGYAVLQPCSLDHLPELLEHARHRHHAEHARRTRPLKVLYADWDGIAVARVRRHLLAHATAMQFDAAPTAEATFHLLSRPGRQTVYDVLLLAHRPPGIDAPAFLRAFHAASMWHVPVVVLVPPGGEDLGRQVGALGAADVVAEEDAELGRLGAALARVAQRQDETDHRTTIEAAPIGISWITPNGRLFRTNRAMQALLGYEEEELWHQLFIDVIHPDDVAEGLRLYAELRAGGRERYERDARVFRKDGSLLWAHLTATALRHPDGTLRAVAGTMQDITERKRLEQALLEGQQRYVLATAAGGVGVWDFDLTTGAGYIDPVLYALIGFDEVGQDGGVLWRARVHPDDRERMQENERVSIFPDAPRDREGNTPIPEIEYRVLHRDGSIRWFLNRGMVMRRADGTHYRVVGTATGITARKQNELRLAMENAVSRILSEDRDLATVAQSLLYHFATSLGYDYASFWVVDAARESLRCLDFRSVAGPLPTAFNVANRQATCPPGVDLPGQAWLHDALAVFPPSTTTEDSLRMTAARSAGFTDGFAYPIRNGGTVVGALEFFRREAGTIPNELFVALQALVAQIGQFLARKQAEEALREANEFRERILESAVVAIAALDSVGRFTLINRRALDLTGYSAAELLGRTVDILLPPEQREAVMGAIAMTLRSGVRVARFQTELIRKDGTPRWISFSLVPLMLGDTITGAVGTAEDITERRQAAEELRRSEQRYRALFEQASDPILIVANDGSVLDANEQACHLLGYQRDELLALKVTDMLVTNPSQLAATRTMLLTGSAIRLQRQARRKDGTLVPVEIVARTLDDGRIQAIARDVSERDRAETALRESEARFRSLYDAEVVPICFWHADGQISEANQAYLTLTGFSRKELAAGLLRWDELTAPEHRDRDRLALAEAQARGSWTPHEKDYVWRDGRRVTVLCGGTILPGQHDNGVAYAIDLTERKRSEATLQELSARLLRAQDEERRRIARELHDVTTQDLFALSMVLGQIAQPAFGLDRPALDLVAEARALGDKTLRELRTQSYLLHPPLLDEVGLSAALEWYVEGFARRSGVAVDLAVDASLGRLPEAVELALFRVAQEGLGNIHRHAGSATARITLGRDQRGVMLRVQDHGHGLLSAVEGEDMLRSLGVGIPGMRERLRQLGGLLEIASSEQGTVVTAFVPVDEGGELTHGPN